MHFFFPPLPKSTMIHGQYYRGNCRNATLARWNAEIAQFVIIQNNSAVQIPHCEDDSGLDVFYPTIVEPNPEITINLENLTQ